MVAIRGSSPVQVQVQVGEDELVLDQLPDDPGHLIALHLHHRARPDLRRHPTVQWLTNVGKGLKTVPLGLKRLPVPFDYS